ncbi:twin-arginine translocation signal domain-containing protein [Anaerolineales bacterium HSG24]|nr:twin-arginine translocation signal domain-containing protein [Anaerolineales bacterium HSG24]
MEKQNNIVSTEETKLGRRDLLKALAATSGAVMAASVLPGRWTQPVIESGVLPAHAQGSPVTVNFEHTGSNQADGSSYYEYTVSNGTTFNNNGTANLTAGTYTVSARYLGAAGVSPDPRPGVRVTGGATATIVPDTFDNAAATGSAVEIGSFSV